MKLVKAEKIWLAVCIMGYLFYNIPGFPQYGDMRAAVIHGVVSMVWVWAANYIGFFIINRIYRLKKPRQD
ncbi:MULTISPECIES: hypothetical protein [Oscillospiraceae]|jgi:hypothetical protein|uniref:Uncharacterized protein n=1 Tax=Lawsonibacter faecis TaxID=2763052 RepID=A0A8J6JJ53_9FIRM|nr:MULTISPECIES: hypothetical protein [Oscillospiraceae]MTQ96496.1 hypothetical protein [Pseudoflavonifractor sp. BIOML-A16]MTR05886.1 hypothetical protein [Pseudoflavonifractor sp. BIOML-A15]MTR31260.1 hypothetical protein [Pseudoflavonifractor sp. BIOML-A14]MTR72523.1 hypothetical protein [Pseudoflavonifractor sp. BIOML-A18]MTS63668.1 hypothetical protein [Pseudoflavonifractor sp. BIOML-A5]MTS72308.1 hypothetical protein [Pseudoflavonifractor sp. BIOML-A8]MTS90517.1 hypothetical protein [P